MAAALAGVAVAIVGSASAHRTSTTVTLPAAKATFVMNNESKPCNNWGRYYVFHVGANASSVRRGLLQFDLSSIPAGAHIESATLSVYETITLRGSGVVGVHRATTPWAEGAGQNGCVGSGATWLQTGLGNAWSQPGADFTGDDQATVTKSAGDPAGWDAFDVTPFAQGWVSGAAANDGLLLKLDDESPSPCTTVTNCNYWAYASNDYSDPSLRPTLTVTYS
jgi:hypothetical protein